MSEAEKLLRALAVAGVALCVTGIVASLFILGSYFVNPFLMYAGLGVGVFGGIGIVLFAKAALD